jgi:DNA-binding MarR family transcriptional regulator
MPLDNGKIYSYCVRMRRKGSTLLPVELSILQAGIELRKSGLAEFHGFGIAKEIQEEQGARLLTAHGTLYKALDRLEKAGFLTSRWEDPLVAAQENRPRRRFYSLTAAGEAALIRGASPTSGPLANQPRLTTG